MVTHGQGLKVFKVSRQMPGKPAGAPNDIVFRSRNHQLERSVRHPFTPKSKTDLYAGAAWLTSGGPGLYPVLMSNAYAMSGLA
jgi:hypothetical protein